MLARSNEVATLGLLKPLDVGSARHTAIHHPYTSSFVASFLHGTNDLFNRCDIDTVAVEYFVANGHALPSDDQRDANLLAVGSMVTTVASLRDSNPVGLPLEVRACHIVQHQIIVEPEELSQMLLEMFLQRVLVRQQRVQSSIEAVVIDLGVSNPEQVFESCLSVPVLGNVQFTAGLAQPSNHQDCRHRCPRHFFAPSRHLLLTEVI